MGLQVSRGVYTASANFQLDKASRSSTNASKRVDHMENDRREPAVLMMIRVANSKLAAARRTLHQALAPNINIYTAVKYHRQSRWLEIVSASKAPIKP